MKFIPRSIIRNLIILIAAISVVVVTQIVRNSARAQEPSGGQENFYITEARSINIFNSQVDRMVNAYHKKMNEKFNARAGKMIDAMSKAQKPEELVAVVKMFVPPKVVPKSSPQVREPCTPDNLSTYCLSLEGANEYFLFRDAMTQIREEEKEKASVRLETLTGKKSEQAPQGPIVEQRSYAGTVADIFRGQKTIQDYGAVINRIDQELNIARKTLDQALSAYNELQTAYIMHRKFQEMIRSLEQYRDAVSSMRKQIEQYPAAFLDVTTTACT